MTTTTGRRERILVIKLAALGDFVQAFGPFAAIRAHHPDAEITLLTTPPFAGLADASPWFDRVWTNGRPAWSDLNAVAQLGARLRRDGFKRVYDLQTSSRSSWYRLFVGRAAEWSGIAVGASHRDRNPRRNMMHTLERQRVQLASAGISVFPIPALGWLECDLSSFNLPADFALLLPGASPTRPAKRWPAHRYGELAARLGTPAVICGLPSERNLAEAIRGVAPSAIDLTGLTNLPQLAAIARRAAFAVGNDSGPTHLAAAVGCRTLCLFGPDSDPALCAPRGVHARFLQADRLDEMQTEDVIEALNFSS